MNRRRLSILLTIVLLVGTILSGCGEKEPAKASPYDGKEYLEISEVTEGGQDPAAYLESHELLMGLDLTLSVPTYITKVDGLWFIVDCYHNKVIYTEELGAPIQSWYMMCQEAHYPHTLASDGKVYLIDDTENNRVLIYEKFDDRFVNTQVFENIGTRPHFSYYDEMSDTFYVWSSENGEMYCFRHPEDSTRMYLTDVRKVDQLSNTYVRSFTIMDGDIFFVSGVSSNGQASQILRCDLDTFEVKEKYPVPDAIAGMVQMTPIDNMIYVTISTDITGNQDYATIVRAASIEDLSKGNYEDIYSQYFIGGGTPYNISRVDDTYFLTEHRLTGHSIWSFKVESGEITEVTSLY